MCTLRSLRTNTEHINPSTTERLITAMSWNVNSWSKFERGANRALVMRQKVAIIAVQEPRIVASLPNYATFQKEDE